MINVKIKSHCNKCLVETNHMCLHTEEQPWDEDVHPLVTIYGTEKFNMLKCCGCDSIKLEHSSWFSENCDANGQPIIEVKYYPPEISRAEPQWLSDLSFLSEKMAYISDLLKEIYSALHNDSRKLAVMGIRALIEYLMITEVSDQGSFKNNIKAFKNDGYISDNQEKIISNVLEAGHATIHRAFMPSKTDVLTVIGITENLIETIYISSKQAKNLERKIPKRKKN